MGGDEQSNLFTNPFRQPKTIPVLSTMAKVRATNYHEDLLSDLLMASTIESKYEIINVQKWLKDNEQFFVPPVCNKLMHHT